MKAHQNSYTNKLTIKAFNKCNLALLTIAFLWASNTKAQTLTDIDGNVYQTVTIGSQVWMKENLKATHYRNGEPIPEVQDSLPWVVQNKGAWCNNENKISNGIIYGKLYNWYVVSDPRNIAPAGWHVPSDDEWKTLEMYVGMPMATTNLENYRGTTEANALKEKDTTTYWTLECCPTPGLSKNKGTNSSGFTALGGGYRIYFNAGPTYTSFQRPTGNAQFWTSTSLPDSTAWLRHLCVYHEDIFRAHWPKVNGSSIRLIKDVAPSMIYEMNSDLRVTIVPNPAHDKFIIQRDNSSGLKIELFNLVGECVFSNESNPSLREIEITSLPPGIYFASITSSQGIVVKKLVKE